MLVVAIHVRPMSNAAGSQIIDYLNYGIQHYLARVAVPFFFVCSGFLLYRKTSPGEFDSAVTGRYLVRLVRLYLIWTIIYFPFILPGITQDERGTAHAVLVFIKNSIVTGSVLHLWYFPALIFAVALISVLLLKKVDPLTILIISAVFYFFGLFAQSWFGFILPLEDAAPGIWKFLKLLQRVIITTRDGLFDAFFFVSMGMYIAYSDLHIKPKRAAMLFGLSMLALFFEVFLLQSAGYIREHDMYLFLGPAVFFLFCFLIGIQLPDHPAYKEMRVLSFLVYCIHVGVMWYAMPELTGSIDGPVPWYCSPFALTLTITLAVSLLIILLSKNRFFSWLKALYT